ncbi:uncharacterized protein N7459_003202 [Penicillium hispanicum]|uniref:uncharacterized protein n=1 Tax=Penicillium hispanicum TaxID=1080232 RepID=UPI002541FB31|nr:uncharacterized protein N7459_003202 [Penicillium hispanicum]KAJ5587437.1 hypothetical protein N7459_003202 [Penicillium hispanicum]
MADYCWQPPASSTGSQWLPNHAVYSQPANMQDWTRAFPRSRHSRVMKPRSAGNSPSSAARRRTIVTQSVMHAPSDHYQSSLEAALLASAVRNARPISWHPSSGRARGLSTPQYAPDMATENYPGMAPMANPSLNALSVHGTENMMSYSLSAGPTLSPTGYIPVYSDVQDPMQISQQTPSLSIPSSHVEPATWDIRASNADLSAMTQTTDDWSLDILSMTNIPPPETNCPSYASVPSPGELSGPSTPDFLPIQKFDDDSDIAPTKKDGKPDDELVGMGLYNQPDGSLGQAPQGLLGKGLKLEETFSPSDDEDEDGIADAESDGNESELFSQPAAIEQLMPTVQHSTPSMPKQPSKQALNLLHKSFFFDQDDLDRQAMTATQPFANLNQSCMSYGYGWI